MVGPVDLIARVDTIVRDPEAATGIGAGSSIEHEYLGALLVTKVGAGHSFLSKRPTYELQPTQNRSPRSGNDSDAGG